MVADRAVPAAVLESRGILLRSGGTLAPEVAEQAFGSPCGMRRFFPLDLA